MMNKNKIKCDFSERLLKFCAVLFSLLFAALMLYPLIFAFSSSMKDNAKIYDISHLYSKLYFDGKYYRKNDTKEVIKPTKFEYGCLFEIGRIISKYDISFLKLFKF